MNELSIIYDIDRRNAPLPVAYEKAKIAIIECLNIDECKDWADKAQALASYARQSDDDELEKMSKRIRARAMRRCGELLKMFDNQGARNDKKLINGSVNKYDVGKDAGLSQRQITTANRLSNIPEDEFNNQIDAENVPTLTKLSEQGKKDREYLSKQKPEGFAKAIHFRGALRRLLEYCNDYDPEYLLNAMSEDDKKDASKMIKSVELWFDKFMIRL